MPNLFSGCCLLRDTLTWCHLKSPQRSCYRASEDGDCVCLIPCCLPVSYDWDYHVINFSRCLSVCSRWPLLLECVGQLSRLPCGCLQTAVVYIVVILSIISIPLQEVRSWTALEVSGKKREYKRLPASILGMVRDRASCSAEQRLVCLEPARQEPCSCGFFLVTADLNFRDKRGRFKGKRSGVQNLN